MTESLSRPPETALPAFPRVVLFVTQPGKDETLLLIQQGDSGPRLPDDGVAADETPEDAVIRLVTRWSLTGAHAELIDASTEALPPDRRVVLRPQFLRTAPQPDATLMRFMLDRGAQVQAFEANGIYTRVIYQEFAVTEGDFALTIRRAGWMTTSALCGRVEHFLFHVLTPNIDYPPADSLVWTPLSQVIGLPVDQQMWFAQIRERL